MRGAAPNPAKETFCKKFLWNLQKSFGAKDKRDIFFFVKGKYHLDRKVNGFCFPMTQKF